MQKLFVHSKDQTLFLRVWKQGHSRFQFYSDELLVKTGTFLFCYSQSQPLNNYKTIFKNPQIYSPLNLSW